MTTVSWVKYLQYSGCKINGTAAVPKPNTQLHMDRAFYLTALVEAPFYGAVQSYDGAGMSGGPLHNIAVYPRGLTQGSMFSLLRAMEVFKPGASTLLTLWQSYSEIGWAISKDGILRVVKTGQPVAGTDIRNTFTPIGGVVPKEGPNWESAKRWALLHNAVFADPTMFSAQKDFAINWLVLTQKDVESRFYGNSKPTMLLAGSPGFSIEDDLALCVYHCYSVNGPAPSRDRLVETLNSVKKGPDFARTLVQKLGDTAFGNWKIRYIRTRTAALKSGLWPEELFTGKGAIFPSRFTTP